MSNINRSNTFLDDVDDDDMEQSLNDTEMNSALTMTEMSPQQPTFLSQLVTDERSHHSNPITTQRMNDLITYQFHSRRPSIRINEFVTPVGESWPWTEESVFAYVFAANRDEQPNNRIAYPSDTLENIFIGLLPHAVVRLVFNLIRNTIPLGIQDTREHTMVLPVFVNTTRQDIVINNENGDINEDGTVFIDTDDSTNDENMNPTTIMRGRGDQMIITESLGSETTDDLTNNVNSVVSTDVHDDNYSDINNRHEPLVEYDRTSETEHQDRSNNNNDERGQALPRTEHADDNRIHDNVQSGIPTAPAAILLVRTESTIESSEQAEEIEPFLAGPTDNNNHTAADPAHLMATGLDVSQLNAPNRKQSSPFLMSEKFGEEKLVQ